MSSQSELLYREKVTAVVNYIKQHLDDPLELNALAKFAGFSPYHFNRIFSKILGQSPSNFVRFLRLHRAALELTHSQNPIIDIAMHAGYETHTAFSKAFRKQYAISPLAFRDLPQEEAALHILINKSPSPGSTSLAPDFIQLPDMAVCFLEATGLKANSFSEVAGRSFEALLNTLGENHLLPHCDKFVGMIPYQNALRSAESKVYRAGAIFKNSAFQRDINGIQFEVIPAGLWAKFLHIGPYDELWQTWNVIYGEWLPSSGATLRKAPTIEHYLDVTQAGLSSEYDPHKLRTEIFVPVYPNL